MRGAGGGRLALLKCTSAYPAPAEEIHLRTIPHLAQAFDVPVGLSDHTLGTIAPVVAVAVGACIIEKHFTLSRQAGGPDSAFSLEPEEFKSLVDGVRAAEKMLGGSTMGSVRRNKRAGFFGVRCSWPPISAPARFSPGKIFDRSVRATACIRAISTASSAAARAAISTRAHR